MIDLREKNRIKATPVIRYWTKDRSMMISQVNNVSENGISFNTGKQYKKGTPVYIQMRSPIINQETITFKAEIMHQEKDVDYDLFKTGAKIVDFHEDDQDYLKGYIDFMKGNLQ